MADVKNPEFVAWLDRNGIGIAGWTDEQVATLYPDFEAEQRRSMFEGFGWGVTR